MQNTPYYINNRMSVLITNNITLCFYYAITPNKVEVRIQIDRTKLHLLGPDLSRCGAPGAMHGAGPFSSWGFTAPSSPSRSHISRIYFNLL